MKFVTVSVGTSDSVEQPLQQALQVNQDAIVREGIFHPWNLKCPVLFQVMGSWQGVSKSLEGGTESPTEPRICIPVNEGLEHSVRLFCSSKDGQAGGLV